MSADQKGSWRTPAEVPFKRDQKIVDKNLKNPVIDNRGQFVIHAVLLHTGKVLWFCGHAEDLDYPLVAYLFDPRRPDLTPTPKPFPQGADLFCCFCVQLMDGKILVIGGSELDHVPRGQTFRRQDHYRGSAGASTVMIFDPRIGQEKWEIADPTRKLLQGRWYPTVVLLGDGSVVVVSGRRETPVFDGTGKWPDPDLATWVRNRSIAEVVEHLKPPDYRPEALLGANRTTPLPIYPGLHLAPDDRIYYTHTTWGQEVDEPPTASLTLQPPLASVPASTTTTGTWTEYVRPTARPTQIEREEGMSVMLPVTLTPGTKNRNPATVGRFLVVGGGQAVGSDDVPLTRIPVATPAPPWTITTPGGLGPTAYARQKIATASPVEILDTTVTGAPQWTVVPGLKHPRINGHCVLLPDATVLILGGHDAYKWYSKANSTLAQTKSTPVTKPSLAVEIYTPGVGIREGAEMAHPRMYHSVALLLADGSVIVAGGADPNEHEPSLRYPRTFNGRTYLGTSRLLQAAPAGATELVLDLRPSVYLQGFAELPIGTKVVIDRGGNEIRTTVSALRPDHPLNSLNIIMDVATPLPHAIVLGTRVDFEAANAGTEIPRVNEWQTSTAVTPNIDRRIEPSEPLNRKDYEIYQPPYFHQTGTRPVLPELKPGGVQVTYGATFTVPTPDAARITRVAIMRPGAPTHHTDTEQRYIELPFEKNGTTSLSITMVPGSDSSLVTPGYYMLWILAGGLPCVEARFIQVTDPPPLRRPELPDEIAPPNPAPTPPASGPDEEPNPICPLPLVADTALALVQLAALRRLRAELSAAPAGHRFLIPVSRTYYAGATPLARRLVHRPAWRAAVRDVVLGPLATSVEAAERLAGRHPDGRVRPRQLIALLSLVGLSGIALSPVAALAAAVHVLLHRRRKTPHG